MSFAAPAVAPALAGVRCWGGLCGDAKPEGPWQDSWRALEQLVASGQVHSIGWLCLSHLGLAVVMLTCPSSCAQSHVSVSVVLLDLSLSQCMQCKDKEGQKEQRKGMTGAARTAVTWHE